MKNYLQFILISTALAMFTISLHAQYVVKETFFETSGVSNQGVVSGYEGWAGPYFLWNPDNNTYVNIGGAAPGSGVGGKAHFTEDGSYISGTSWKELTLNTEWQRNVLSDYSFIFKSIEFPGGQSTVGFAAGQSLTYNGHGILLRTVNGGETWTPRWTDTQNRGLEDMSFPSASIGYVGGWNHYFAKTQSGGEDWTIQSPGGSDDVWIYRCIEFKDMNNGVVGAQLYDGAGVYVTSDGGNTWTSGTGLIGIPTKIRHAGGNTYYLSTNNGRVQKSIDNGLTWTTVLNYPGVLFLGLNFYNEMTGYVLAETYIIKTTDGGLTWVESAVSPNTTGVLWRDIAWQDENNLVIVGTPDVIFESNNGGASWFWGNELIFNGNPALYSIAVTENAVHVCGSQGNFYKKSRITNVTVSEMSRYNTTTQEWTPIGSLGNIVDNATSSGYSISGDGLTVVGNSWVIIPNTHAHAVVWTAETGVVSLGTLFPGKSTRADGVSYDGSVIVGYQDFNGPWKSAVWRKNPAGGYFPNQYLLVDPNGNPFDEMNQLGQASAVSADGNWIGGYGDFAFNNPWIWSESTGLVDLGSMGLEPGTIGRVSAINYDGTQVVGWYRYSPDPWTQIYTPFIWTPDGGTMNLNTYITQVLGFPMPMSPIYVPNAMSANGKYITGWGVDPNVGPWGQNFTFRLEIPSGAVLPGDANCDGLVNVMDVIAIANYITGNNPQPFCFENADVNNDGEIDVSDLIAAVNIIMGNAKSLYQSLNSASANIYLNNDGIKLESDGTLTGLQFEIKGIETSQLHLEIPGFELITNVENNTLKAVLFSLNNTAIPSGKVNLFSIAGNTDGIKWGEVMAANQVANKVKVFSHINASSFEFGMDAYPNPTNGQITAQIIIAVESRTIVNITDITGREVLIIHDGILTEGNHTLNVELGKTLKNGIYFLQMHAHPSNASQPVSKQLKLVVAE